MNVSKKIKPVYRDNDVCIHVEIGAKCAQCPHDLAMGVGCRLGNDEDAYDSQIEQINAL